MNENARRLLANGQKRHHTRGQGHSNVQFSLGVPWHDQWPAKRDVSQKVINLPAAIAQPSDSLYLEGFNDAYAETHLPEPINPIQIERE